MKETRNGTKLLCLLIFKNAVIAMTEIHSSAVTRIRTWVVSATTRSTNHYTITANCTADSGSLLHCAKVCGTLANYKCTTFLFI